MKAKIVERMSSYPGESLILTLIPEDEEEKTRLRSWMSPSPPEQYELRIGNVLMRTEGPTETGGFAGLELGFVRKQTQPLSVEVKLDASEFIEEIRGAIAEVARLKQNRLALYWRHLWRDIVLVARVYVALRSCGGLLSPGRILTPPWIGSPAAPGRSHHPENPA